jgi:GNAT superfamily N-acetyltransferase
MKPSLEAVGRYDPARARSRFLEAFCPQETRGVVYGGELVGVVVLRSEEQMLFLDHLYIEPDFQGLGIGSEVILRVVELARSASKVVRVGALRESRANSFYTKHGFQLHSRGEWDNYYELNANAA